MLQCAEIECIVFEFCAFYLQINLVNTLLMIC